MSTISFPPTIVNPNTARIVNRAPRGGSESPVNGRFYLGGQFMPMVSTVEVAPTPVKLAINGFTYSIKEIQAGECGTVAFSITKRDTGNRYDVIRNHFGEVTCDCPDYEMRRSGTGRMCKHGAKLVELGMIPAPDAARQAEAEPAFDGRALYAYARGRRAIEAVNAFGRANGFPGLIVKWSPEQAAAAYYEVVEAVEGGVR